MKIQNEQLQALQQLAESKTKKSAAGGFDALLAEELGETGALGQAVSEQPTSALGSLLGLSGVAPVETAVGVSEEDAALAAVAQSIDSMLNGLEEYADAVAAPQGADLRKAYGILQGLDSNLLALRDQLPDIETRHEGMASLLNEISVITRAETVKLNRGDYL